MWWGKLLGAGLGYWAGGPWAALAGFMLGHLVDSGRMLARALGHRKRAAEAFFTATFSVMGRIAKADGHVSREEIRLAEQLIQHMGLTAQQQQFAKELFMHGKEEGFPLDEVLERLRKECRYSQMLLRVFLEIQVQAALADGVIHAAERRLLLQVFERLGFAAADLDRLEAQVQGGRFYHQSGGMSDEQRLADAYQVLGVAGDASPDDIKRAYRKLTSQHHPDKLVSKGLPEEMIKVATEKTQEIRAAYDVIRKVRGF
ncbi:MAG: co-chaperone DjlA [Gammaproteobacteria bacterium]|nr:co-chaperone DjlA [Gammaproteobacteria bacterium]